MQKHDGTLVPVRYAGRVLKYPETRYAMVEKEILSLLRVLHCYYGMVVGRRIKVITSHSTLGMAVQIERIAGTTTTMGDNIISMESGCRTSEERSRRFLWVDCSGTNTKGNCGFFIGRDSTSKSCSRRGDTASNPQFRIWKSDACSVI